MVSAVGSAVVSAVGSDLLLAEEAASDAEPAEERAVARASAPELKVVGADEDRHLLSRAIA